MFEYLKGVRKEAKKVIFPGKEKMKKNLITVMTVCGAVALLLWGISTLILQSLKGVI